MFEKCNGLKSQYGDVDDRIMAAELKAQATHKELKEKLEKSKISNCNCRD